MVAEFFPEWYRACVLTVSFFAYSCAGWAFEVAIAFFQHHRFVNRGFAYGPHCPIYGVGALFGILVLAPLGNARLQLLVGFVSAGVLEFATSWAMERMFGARWWDYSDYPLNLDGRTCVPAMSLFSVLMLAVDRFSQPLLESALGMFEARAVALCALALCALLLVDLTATVVKMREFASTVRLIQAQLDYLSGRASMVAAAARVSLSDAASGARETLSGVAASARETIGGAATSARETIGEVVSTVGDGIRELGSSAAEDMRARSGSPRAQAADELRAALMANARRLLRGRGAFERKNLDDPYFRFMGYSDALSWMREALLEGGDGASEKGSTDGRED